MGAKVVLVNGNWCVRSNFHGERHCFVCASEQNAREVADEMQLEMDKQNFSHFRKTKLLAARFLSASSNQKYFISAVDPDRVPREILPIAGRLFEFSGPSSYVYFLCLEDKVNYVGVTHALHQRIGAHKRGGFIPFDRVFYVSVVNETRARQVESAFILALRPKHNSNWKPTRRMNPKEILKNNGFGSMTRKRCAKRPVGESEI